MDITVTTPDGTTATGAADRFTYAVPLASQRLRALQNSITPIVAQTSGQAIGSAIDGATNDAFCASQPKTWTCQRYTLSPNALVFSYAPSRWSASLNVQDTGWNLNNTITNTTSDVTGSQLNVTAGLGFKLAPDALVGIISGYEHFNYNVTSLSGMLKGDGETIGGYFARRFESLRFDAAFAWTSMSYRATSGTANGSFAGSRWLLSTGLTGNAKLGTATLEPGLFRGTIRF